MMDQKEVTEKIAGITEALTSECYQCGRCGGICPVARIKQEYSPRKVLSRISNNPGSFCTDELWLCTTCFSCNEVCQAGIDLIGILIDVRNYAAQSGHIPENLRELIQLILEEGRSYQVTPKVVELRHTLGLKDIKKTEGLHELTNINLSE